MCLYQKSLVKENKKITEFLTNFDITGYVCHERQYCKIC